MKYLVKRCIYLLIIIIVFVDLWVLYWLAVSIPLLDLSQDYRKVQGVEDIVFVRNGWNHRCYRRCFWGLKRTGKPYENNGQGGHGSDDSLPLLEGIINTENKIRQAVFSPDKRYILYSEVQYGYTGSGVTDDEYCYYRVYDMEKEITVTIYQGYREWYDLIWV